MIISSVSCGSFRVAHNMPIDGKYKPKREKMIACSFLTLRRMTLIKYQDESMDYHPYWISAISVSCYLYPTSLAYLKTNERNNNEKI